MSTIVRWNPIREMAAMQSAFDRLFDETWRGARPTFAGNEMALDVYETAQNYTLIATLPGLNPDDIRVNMHDDVLTISAEVAAPKQEEGSRVLLQERAFGKFTRSVRLPQPVNLDSVEAAYEHGILTLTLPKAPEAQPRAIPVRALGNGHNHSNN
jgi:HSP20 family protein